MNREDRANELAMENVEILRVKLEQAGKLLREIRPTIPKDVLELWCADRDTFLAPYHSVEANDMARCVACEGKPAHGNDPCAVCGAEGAQGEREAFECWHLETFGLVLDAGIAGACQERWDAWQARSALAQPSPAVVQLSASRERRIYVAGPMTGYKDYNFPAFNAQAEALRELGYHVENPADHGVVNGAEWQDYLRYDISRLSTCEAIFLLPGWSKSKGAALEVYIAKALGMTFIHHADAEREQLSPASELDDQAFDRSAESLTAEAFGTGGGINPKATSIDDLFLDEIPAPELERPEVVALLSRDPDGEPRVTFCGDPDMHIKDGMGLVLLDQAESSVGPLRYKAELYDEVWALVTGKGYMNVTTAIAKLEQERDSAQARVAELERQLTKDRDAHSATIEQRDAAEQWADDLAQAVGEKLGVEIGEHSNLNCPWEEALNWIQADNANDAPVTRAGQVPDGWRRVPIEPTKEILDEFDSIIDWGAEDSKDAWRRLLAAAPAQGGE